VKKSPLRRFLAKFVWVSIVVGLGPSVYYFYLCSGLNKHSGDIAYITPLSIPLSLARGEYASPLFTTYTDKDYGIQIDLNRIPDGQDSSCVLGTPKFNSDLCQGTGRVLDADWELVNDGGAVIAQGTHKDRMFTGRFNWLDRFHATKGERLKFILRIHQDLQGYESANPRLEILERLNYPNVDGPGGAFLFYFGFLWAVIWVGSGVIIHDFYLHDFYWKRRPPRKEPPAAS
jgi:hypothetical protein